jgi:dienelactone hydrolase
VTPVLVRRRVAGSTPCRNGLVAADVQGHRPDERTELAAALRDAGVEVDFRPVAGAGHVWAGLSDEDVERFDTSLEFARAHTTASHSPAGP